MALVVSLTDELPRQRHHDVDFALHIFWGNVLYVQREFILNVSGGVLVLA